MKALDIKTKIWEDTAANRSSWRCLLKKLLKTGEEKILNLSEERRAGWTRTHPRPPYDELHLHFVQQRLPLPHWPYHRRRCSSRHTTNSEDAVSMVDID